MKVCHVAPFLDAHRGGLPRAVRLLIEDGARHGQSSFVVATGEPASAASFTVPCEAVILRPPVRWLPFHVSWRLTSHIFSLVRRANLVEIHGIFAYPCLVAFAAATFLRRPVIVRPHSQLMRQDLRKHLILKRMILRAIRLLAPPATCAFATAIEESESDWLPGKAVVTGLPCGAHEQIVSERPPNGVPTLLALGRVAPGKGCERLASAALLSRTPKLHLIFAGAIEGKTRDSVLHLLGTSDRVCVSFLGHVPRERLPQLFSVSTALVVPSDYESFSLAAAEALAVGLPVCLTSCVGLADLVAATGVGIIVDGLGPAALASGLDDILAPGANSSLRRQARLQRAAVLRALAAPLASELRSAVAEAAGEGCRV